MAEDPKLNSSDLTPDPYEAVVAEVSEMLETARRETVRTINALMTATYWEIGRRIVELEQQGAERTEHGKQITERLAQDLSTRFGRGFKKSNLFQMRAFYLTYSDAAGSLTGESVKIFQMLSGKFPLP